MMKEFVDMPIQNNRMKKKEWKTKRKEKINEICAETECIEFNMTGSLFQFYNNLYLFCPMCANPTTVQSRSAKRTWDHLWSMHGKWCFLHAYYLFYMSIVSGKKYMGNCRCFGR